VAGAAWGRWPTKEAGCSPTSHEAEHCFSGRLGKSAANSPGAVAHRLGEVQPSAHKMKSCVLRWTQRGWVCNRLVWHYKAATPQEPQMCGWQRSTGCAPLEVHQTAFTV
jgi:hypothetical protein